MSAPVAVSAEEITEPETLLVPGRFARLRGGLWLVELDDGSFVPAFGDRLFSAPVGGAA